MAPQIATVPDTHAATQMMAVQAVSGSNSQPSGIPVPGTNKRQACGGAPEGKGNTVAFQLSQATNTGNKPIRLVQVQPGNQHPVYEHPSFDHIGHSSQQMALDQQQMVRAPMYTYVPQWAPQPMYNMPVPQPGYAHYPVQTWAMQQGLPGYMPVHPGLPAFPAAPLQQPPAFQLPAQPQAQPQPAANTSSKPQRPVAARKPLPPSPAPVLQHKEEKHKPGLLARRGRWLPPLRMQSLETDVPDNLGRKEPRDNTFDFVVPRKARSRRQRQPRSPEKLLRCLSGLGIQHGPSTDEADELIDQLRDFVGAQQQKQLQQQAQKLQKQQQQQQARPSCLAPAVPAHQPTQQQPGPSTQPLVPALSNLLLMNALLAQVVQQAVTGACMAGAPAVPVSQPAQPGPSTTRPAVPVASALPAQQPTQQADAGPSTAPAVALPVQPPQPAVAGLSNADTQARQSEPRARNGGARPVRGLMGTWLGGVAKTHKASGSSKRKGQPKQSL